MACIRKRRGKYVVDYRDARGIRRWVTCETRGAADDQLAEKLREVKRGVICKNPKIKVSEFYDEWIEKVSQTSKARTAETYSDYFRLHILPEFGEMRLQTVRRPRIKKWLISKLADGYSKGTIRILNAAFRAMLNEAIEEEFIAVNPCLALGKTLKFDGKEAKKAKKEPKAFTREQLSRFLASAHPRWYPYFLFLARTGVRLGESLAVQVSDIDFDEQVVVIDKAYSKARLETPKDGESREVDLSQQLVNVLKKMISDRRQRCFASGKPMPSLLFPTQDGGVMNRAHVWRAMVRTLKRAGLPTREIVEGEEIKAAEEKFKVRFSPHSFRYVLSSLCFEFLSLFLPQESLKNRELFPFSSDSFCLSFLFL